MIYKSLQSAMATLIVILFISSSESFGFVDRTIEKTRDAVENAGPNDWYTLAISAEKCFNKKVNLNEASKWLNQSLEIEETPFNLELKGDFCAENLLPDKALEYYVRTMNTLKARDGKAEVSHIQKKISEIIKI